MKLGQTSLIYFLSRIFASVLGFVATIYFARLLGAGPLGIYSLTLGVVSWLSIAGTVGISGAINKRVSEGEDRVEHAVAGILLIGALFLLLVIAVYSSREYLNNYIGYPATGYVLFLLFVTLAYSIVTSLLSGLHLVHVKGLLSPIKTGGRSLFQISALGAGFGLAGLFVGYIVGYLIAILLGMAIVISRIQGSFRLERRHFRSLFNYAKYSWLGNVQSQTFAWIDVIVLGAFVSSSLIGIYSVAWNIATFLLMFGGSISATLFPEISERSTDGDLGEVAGLLEDALSYAGLLLVPGLVGSLILGDRILQIYGEEFTQGSTVLGLLFIVCLVQSYRMQLSNVLDAIDRPDLSFRVNALFVVANLSLNVALIYLYGWLGAAVATTLSVTISLLVAHRYLRSIVDYTVPYAEVGCQWFAAIVMGVIVYGGVHFENTYAVLGHNVATVLLLVGIGAGVYFVTLLGLSPRFRTTVDRNLPFDIPLARN